MAPVSSRFGAASHLFAFVSKNFPTSFSPGSLEWSRGERGAAAQQVRMDKGAYQCRLLEIKRVRAVKRSGRRTHERRVMWRPAHLPDAQVEEGDGGRNGSGTF